MSEIVRILHQAHVTADPVHLMRLFGISGATAMKYVQPHTPNAPPSSLAVRLRSHTRSDEGILA